MRGIKELMGLLFWMDNASITTVEAVASGQKQLPKNKMDILSFLKEKNQELNNQNHKQPAREK